MTTTPTRDPIKSAPSLLFVATAVTAAGFLTSPVPAVATPMVPLAPACTWQMPSYFYMEQNNGLEVSVPMANNRSSGRAGYGKPGSPNTTGNAEGALDGTNISFIMRWDNGGQNNYSGQVHPDGSTSGTTTNETNHTNTWTGKGNLACVPVQGPVNAGPGPVNAGPGPVNAGPGPVQAPAPTATVNADTDLWDKPSDKGGHKIGVLNKGQVVKVDTTHNSACTPKAWCYLTDPTSAVWGRDVTNN